MRNANRPLRQLAAACVLLLPLLAAGTVRQEPDSLRLSNAPVRLLYPEEWRDWAISLASYADSAARDISDLIKVPIPAGTILWQPAAAGPGSGADGFVEVRADAGGGALVVVRTNVPLLTRDFGVAYALGYGRWLGAYVVARVAMGAPGGNAPWWTEGAALYLTDRLFRKSRATTPILYGLEGNFTRASRIRRPIDLAAKTLSAAARGKAYATFKLLEALYGPGVVATAIGRLVARPTSELAAIVDAIGRERQPDPDQVLRDWLEPTVAIDVGIDKVSVRDGGRKLSVRIDRKTPIPLPVLVEVRCVEGQTVTGTLATGTGNGTVEIDIPSQPVSVTIDPGHLIPDTNRSNNRHGFGNADNVRRFFSFDDLFEIRELQLSGELGLDESGQRQERFTLLITNRTERPTGLGFLVSAEWLGRAERVQRAYFVHLAPGETRLIEEMLGYPNRGTGRARIEARFWHAGTVEDLTDKLVSKQPGAMNSYIVIRDAPKAPRRARRGLYRRPPTITETAGTRQEAPREESVATTPGPTTATSVGAQVAMDDGVTGEGFGIRVVSPTSGTIPIGDVTLEARLVGTNGQASRVDFFVNDRRIGTVNEPPYVFRWTFPEEEQVFVIRAVAVLGDRLASDDVVLDKSAIAFGSTVNLVTLHATVRDAQGRIIRDLTAEDVRIIEDGRQQQIVQFDFGEVPISAAVLLDQSSSMIGSGIRSERAGAQRLIDSLVNDVNRAMVLGFNDKVYLYADFTHDQQELSAALRAIEPDGSTALYDTLAEAVRKINRRRGKRALVVLSDGLDTNSRMQFEDVVEYLRQSEVLVYSIGLQLMHEGTELGDASGAVKRGVEKLRTMAEATGGAAYFPLNMEELEEIYGLIADELESQYALSYYPSNQRYDGSWRQLRVDIPGHPGYWVRVRPGYYGINQEKR